MLLVSVFVAVLMLVAPAGAANDECTALISASDKYLSYDL